MGIELMTSSLPRMRSTPELHRLTVCLLSGKRGSNSRPSAWKADALPTELLPQKSSILAEVAQYLSLPCRFEDLWEVVDSNHRTLRERIYSPPQLPLCEPPNLASTVFQSPFEPIEGFEPTTPRLQITCSGQLSYIGAHESFIAERTAKVDTFFEFTKLFQRFFNIPTKSS